MSDLWTTPGSPRTEVRGEPGPELAAAQVDQPDQAPAPAAAPSGVPVLFMGETFHLRPVVDYQWELLVFADQAVGEDDVMRGNAATLRLIRASLVDGDWERFSALATRKRAQLERDVMPVIVQIHYRTTARPTLPPSGSSAGRPTTLQSSEAALSSQVIAREEAAGRSDRAQIVAMTAEARAAEAAGRSVT